MTLRHSVVLTVAALILAACGGTPTTYAPPPTIPPPNATAAPQQPVQPSAAQTVGIGAQARDGKLTFIVNKVEEGPVRLGNEYLSHTPQGRFFIVHITVFNHGTEAQTYVSSAQKLLAAGREYSADDRAAMAMNNIEMAISQLNPGIRIDTVIVYDIPKGVKPEAVRFHDSPFSGGVIVTL